MRKKLVDCAGGKHQEELLSSKAYIWLKKLNSCTALDIIISNIISLSHLMNTHDRLKSFSII